jgi:hypothetical protein
MRGPEGREKAGRRRKRASFLAWLELEERELCFTSAEFPTNVVSVP